MDLLSAINDASRSTKVVYVLAGEVRVGAALALPSEA
jgi:hypothetical protein